MTIKQLSGDKKKVAGKSIVAYRTIGWISIAVKRKEKFPFIFCALEICIEWLATIGKVATSHDHQLIPEFVEIAREIALSNFSHCLLRTLFRDTAKYFLCARDAFLFRGSARFVRPRAWLPVYRNEAGISSGSPATPRPIRHRYIIDKSTAFARGRWPRCG